MLLRICSLALLVSRLVDRLPYTQACARMGGGGGGGGGTVPPTTQCAASTTNALLYMDTSTVIASDFYGEVAASSTCVTCASGSSKYYPDSGKAVISAADEKAIGGINCQNFCVCQADGTCYQRNSPDTSIVLYPYCDAGTCSVYVLVLGNANTDGIVSTDGTKTITSSSQVNPTTLDNYPVTMDSLFPKVTSVSCNGCTGAKSC